MSKQEEPDEELSFDARLASLEGLVGELEDGGLELEAAIQKYQEGIALLRSCHTSLGSYRARIEELSKEAEVTVSAIADPDFESGETA
jgi:exodeoxyribonuclease VII small subunit